MTNAESAGAGAVSGVVISAAGAIVSNADQIEQWSRIGASWVAIVSGLVVCLSVTPKLYRQIRGWWGKKKGKKL